MKNPVSSYYSKFSANFYQKNYLFLACSAVFLWIVFDYTSLDLWISALYYDLDTQSWPLKNQPIVFAAYQLEKMILFLFGGVLLFLFGLSFFIPALKKYRRVFLFLLLCLSLVPLEVSGLKALFRKSRPEQIIYFGGALPENRLFEFLWNNYDARNWPGGHASGGAALLALYFPGHYKSTKWGYGAIVFSLLYWFIMGWTQIVRGQHFISHNLWSLWFAWLTILLIHQFLFKGSLIKESYCLRQ